MSHLGFIDVDLVCPVIIAMQGDPYTGKTTLTNSLAKYLKCLVIRLDEILHVISAGEPHPPTPEKAETLTSQAFDIITQIVKTHTSFGNSVIIDSPLSRLSHLDNLVSLLLDVPPNDPESEENSPLRLVIIQCRPQTEYAWQMRFEERDVSCYHNKWYKPQDKNWPLDPEFSRDYTDDDIHPQVSKLVVDTTDHVPLESLYQALMDLTVETEGTKFESEEWIRIGDFIGDFNGINLEGKRNLDRVDGKYCTKAHWIREYWEEGIDYDATCEVCESNVASSAGAAYSCFLCPLTIHKACGELAKMEFSPNNFPKFLNQDGVEAAYCFPEEHLCRSCKETGKRFSYECESCTFQCHLKCRLVPTVVNHPGHDHRLFFRLTTLGSYEYLCSGCRRPGDHAGYRCMENCKAEYHPRCALLPRVFRDHRHSGHVHDLEMVFCRNEELEDYLCDMCLDKMNPAAWYYSCEDCSLSLHLDCAFKDFDAC